MGISLKAENSPESNGRPIQEFKGAGEAAGEDNSLNAYFFYLYDLCIIYIIYFNFAYAIQVLGKTHETLPSWRKKNKSSGALYILEDCDQPE